MFGPILNVLDCHHYIWISSRKRIPKTKRNPTLAKALLSYQEMLRKQHRACRIPNFQALNGVRPHTVLLPAAHSQDFVGRTNLPSSMHGHLSPDSACLLNITIPSVHFVLENHQPLALALAVLCYLDCANPRR